MTTSTARQALALALLLLAAACGGGPGDPGTTTPPSGTTNPGTTPPVDPGTPPPPPVTPPPVDPGTPPPPVTPPAGPAPSITAINRHGSPVTGGEMVLIVGTNLDTADLVTFGGVPATGLQYDAANGWLLVVNPPHAEGFVDIVVRVADGQTALLPGYHYGPPPAVAGFTPDTGHRDTLITITGLDFNVANGVVVQLGGAICVVVSRTATELVAVAPKLNPGAYPVVVVNFDGQAGVSRTSFTMQ